MSIHELPKIMVAPNGARKTRQDHPVLPVTIEQTVREAGACHAAGAMGLHAHVRDENGLHVLDAGLYSELLNEMSIQVPDMLVQITTEAVGIYTPEEQRQLVHKVMPKFVSIALREMTCGENEAKFRQFYHWIHEAGIGVQHILYTPDEIHQLVSLIQAGVIPGEDLEILFVLGRYAADQQSEPSDLEPFLKLKAQELATASWSLCAFGQKETACLAQAIWQGGKARIGFENNLQNADGTIAIDNAARVRELVQVLDAGLATELQIGGR